MICPNRCFASYGHISYMVIPQEEHCKYLSVTYCSYHSPRTMSLYFVNRIQRVNKTNCSMNYVQEFSGLCICNPFSQTIKHLQVFVYSSIPFLKLYVCHMQSLLITTVLVMELFALKKEDQKTCGIAYFRVIKTFCSVHILVLQQCLIISLIIHQDNSLFQQHQRIFCKKCISNAILQFYSL